MGANGACPYRKSAILWSLIMQHVVERLRASIEDDNRDRAQADQERRRENEAESCRGFALGEKWAKTTASAADLRSLERTWNGSSDRKDDVLRAIVTRALGETDYRSMSLALVEGF